ncbi:hypothetical protein MAMMFC1_03985 [Methylomusa anaerophila]|uniref:Uncharacterized protein n=1 Tax=Methylomusa anaerophila TaxID=1930071 RepID=A0A348AQC5_9FIRM|nr:hypothetical protein MAMMFC1_03985 [Methylomusa anaerophila]
MVEPRLVSDLSGFGIGRPKINVRSQGLALVGGKITMCLVRLYGSPTVIVWSKGMYSGRAKTAKGTADFSGEISREVCCSREIVAGFVGIFGSRTKVSAGCVMLVRSRKIAYRYVMIDIGCSVDHYGLFIIIILTTFRRYLPNCDILYKFIIKS